jgi:hypothetical protein
LATEPEHIKGKKLAREVLKLGSMSIGGNYHGTDPPTVPFQFHVKPLCVVPAGNHRAEVHRTVDKSPRNKS